MRVAVLLAASVALSGCHAAPMGPSPSLASLLSPPFVAPSDAAYDATFYRALVHGGGATPLRRLEASPRIYLKRTGLSDGFVAQLEQTARETLPAFTGGALTVAGWETGTALRPDTPGWIIVELRVDERAACGETRLGAVAGHVTLNTKLACQRDGEPVAYAAVFAHELGHALGFYHVGDGLMQPDVVRGAGVSARERYHGALAYRQANGSGGPR